MIKKLLVCILGFVVFIGAVFAYTPTVSDRAVVSLVLKNIQRIQEKNSSIIPILQSALIKEQKEKDQEGNTKLVYIIGEILKGISVKNNIGRKLTNNINNDRSKKVDISDLKKGDYFRNFSGGNNRRYAVVDFEKVRYKESWRFDEGLLPPKGKPFVFYPNSKCNDDSGTFGHKTIEYPDGSRVEIEGKIDGSFRICNMGYVNADGIVVISPDKINIKVLPNKYFRYRTTSGEKVLVDQNGEELIRGFYNSFKINTNMKYAVLGYLDIIKNVELYGVLDFSGNVIIPITSIGRIRSFFVYPNFTKSDGYFRKSRQNRDIKTVRFEIATNFSKEDKEYIGEYYAYEKLVNYDGTPLTKERYQDMTPVQVRESSAMHERISAKYMIVSKVKNNERLFGVIDMNGNVVVPLGLGVIRDVVNGHNVTFERYSDNGWTMIYKD